MHANVSFDVVAADEDTTLLTFIHDSDLIISAAQRHSTTIFAISYYWPALFLSFFSIIGISGNLLVCLAIATERRLQNRTNWFLFSLAFADMFISGLVIPLAIVKEFTGRIRKRQRWSIFRCFRLLDIRSDLMRFLDISGCLLEYIINYAYRCDITWSLFSNKWSIEYS